MARGYLLWLVLLIAAPAFAQRTPTTQTSIGIFYLPGAPQTTTLWRAGDAGERLLLEFRVLDPAGRPVGGALVELWHADAAGGVDESRYRAAQLTGVDGRFQLRTILPGHIEMARDNPVFRARHVHVMVTHPAYPRLVSLIFFRGDPLFEGSSYPELGIALEDIRVGESRARYGRVELVLGAQPRSMLDSD